MLINRYIILPPPVLLSYYYTYIAPFYVKNWQLRLGARSYMTAKLERGDWIESILAPLVSRKLSQVFQHCWKLIQLSVKMKIIKLESCTDLKYLTQTFPNFVMKFEINWRKNRACEQSQLPFLAPEGRVAKVKNHRSSLTQSRNYWFPNKQLAGYLWRKQLPCIISWSLTSWNWLRIWTFPNMEVKRKEEIGEKVSSRESILDCLELSSEL